MRYSTTMDTRILTVALIICAVGLASSNQYPAGVDPESCPNYPNCDNAILHGTKSVVTGNAWNSITTRPNVWNNAWESPEHWTAPAAPVVSPATQYPAGVNPQSCPNYPNCDNVALHSGAFASHANPVAVAWRSPAPVWNNVPNNGHPNAQPISQYPAGVSAQSCPNYPYC